ncbi:MAG TPA: ABC transporter permease [Mobilitalea sp.]|nr:ABC transporter permease [Mobilitalea sp.]
MLITITKEIKELFSDKKIWFGIITVLIIIIIGTSYNKKASQVQNSDFLRLGVINNDDSSYSNLLLGYFNASNTFSSLISVVIGEYDEIRRDFDKGELDIYLEIPEGFAENMVHIEHLPIKVIINIEDTTKAILFQNVLESYEKYISAVEVNAVSLYEIMEKDGMDKALISVTNATISLDLIFTALGKEAFFDYKEIDTFPPTKVSEYYVISVLVMMLMYAGLYAGFRVLREIRQGTFARIKTTQLPIYQFLTAKILFLSTVLAAFTILAICIIKGSIPTGVIVLYSCCIALFCVTLSMLLSAFFETTQRFVLVGNLLIFYFIVIGGGIVPIMFLPQNILRLSKITPNYYIMEGIIRLNKDQLNIPIRNSITLLVISGLFMAGTILFFQRRRVSYEEA